MSFEEKAPGIQEMMRQLAPHEITDKNCAWCGTDKVKPSDFRDAVSRKEFKISHMCQNCQDEVFSEEE